MKSREVSNKLLMLAGYLVCLVFLAIIHEPWSDELHAWVMARDMSLGELLSAMKVEGHFCLWFLLLMPFAKAGLCVFWLQITGIVLMMVAAWLLVFKTDLSLGAKVAVLLSFPMVYYFPVVSRCYALIPPVLFGIAWAYRNLDERKYLFAILVGLLAHTQVYMEGMVLALFLLYIYENILPKYREKRLSAADFGPLVVIVILVLLAFVQVVRNPFSPVYYYLGNTQIAWQNKGLASTVDYFLKGYSVLPYGVFPNGTKGVLAYSIAFIPMLILTFILFFSFDWKGRFLFLVSVGWQVLFSIFIYPIGHQRIYLPFFIILTIIMMTGSRCKKINTLIVCLCILASISGYLRHIRNDIPMTYSSYKPLAKAIEDSVPKFEPVYSIDFGGDAVNAYITDPDVTITPTYLDSIKNNTFYAISNRWDPIEGFKVDTIYNGSGCFWDKFSLVKLTRLDNGQ